jgi:hypothetical protein
MPRTVPSQIDHYQSENLERRDFYNAAEMEQYVGVIAGSSASSDIPHQNAISRRHIVLASVHLHCHGAEPISHANIRCKIGFKKILHEDRTLVS